jgi:Na+-translocating ferredoxin:NAD+ oxidoreductase RnfG subunit
MTSSDSSNLAKFLDRQHPAVLNAFKLGLFAVVAAIILGGTYSGTEERIAISQAIVDSGESIQVVRDDSAVPVAFIVPSVAPEGYSGDIRLLVGLDLQGTVTGVRATEHRETPGLGDKVDTKKSNWILGFNGKSLNDPLNGWAVKKDGGDFDAFTGATITPRAVVTQVEAVLLFYQENRAELIALAATSVAENLADETESLVTNLEESP